MLIEFRVENHRSVRDEQALTMEAGSLGTSDDLRVRKIDGHGKPLLPVAALYGANASGKSNVLSAVAFLRGAVLHSHRRWPPDEGVPREQFSWGPESGKPSLFEITFLLHGVRHQYGFVTDNERFTEEWLYVWPVGRRQMWFEREGESFKFGSHLQGENRVVEEITGKNALFLSAAAQYRHEQLMPIYSWFRAMRVRASSDRLGGQVPFYQLRTAFRMGRSSEQLGFFDGEETNLEVDALKDLLRAADVGIVDMRVEDVEEEIETSNGPRRIRRPRIFFRHQSEAKNAWLPLEKESQGTLTLVGLAPAIIDALGRGGVLFVDELEASLHPLVGAYIVRQFNDPETNPKGAQLIFTTHDTNLLGSSLGEPALRRDQIWLTEKNSEGATILYPLTDYKPRKAENLERGYLQGRYGAIPFLGELARYGT
ncbi:MAG: ATP-binding protein [Deltaproteobacteria bacterium]|nr:ATP-binding protein [Deltaproteobacteria bacterium]